MSKNDIAEELHRAARRNYSRRRVIVYGKNDLFQADLVDMMTYSRVNKGYKYILCVIDCYTKFAWGFALKSKRGEEVAAAMEKIFATGERTPPNLLQVDRGTEFYNKHFENLMKKYGIKMYSTYSVVKACIVERFNRTLKEKMFKRFTSRGSRDWYTILPELFENYNNTKHRSIGSMTPIQAEADASRVKIVIPKSYPARRCITRFNVGDKVRVSVHKGVFTKGYLPNWSTEIFTIIKVNKSIPSTFILQDYTGNPIAGGFYAEEIRKTDLPDDYLVEKIVRAAGQRVFVKWLGFDNSHNSWINKSDLRI